MIEWFFILTAVSALVFSYIFIIRPIRTMAWYKKILEEAGYRVIVLPFCFLGSGVFNYIQKYQKTHNNSHYGLKHEFTKYDVGISNLVNVVSIDIIDTGLLKQFYQPQNVDRYVKLPLFIDNLKRVMGNGMTFSEGEQWKRKRKIMNNVFNYDFITNNIPQICRIFDDHFREIEQNYRKNHKETEPLKVNLRKSVFSHLFSNVLLECFFGYISPQIQIEGMALADFILRLNEDAMNNMTDPISLFLGQRFMDLGIRQKDRDLNRRIKSMRSLNAEITKEKIKQFKTKNYKNLSECHDIVSALCFSQKMKLDGKHQNKQGEQFYNLEQIVDQVSTFNAAGADVTSNFTQMMLHLIKIHPHIEERLRKDIDEVIKCEEDITKENLKKLVYIDWIQKQTTRCYGPGTGIVNRIASKDHYLGQIPILKGIAVSVHTLTTHHKEEFYPDPHTFKPERWEKECDNNPAFSLGGFNAGPRSCIGKHLAMLETKICLVKFMRRYERYEIEKNPFKMEFRFLYGPEDMETTLYPRKGQ